MKITSKRWRAKKRRLNFASALRANAEILYQIRHDSMKGHGTKMQLAQRAIKVASNLSKAVVALMEVEEDQ